MNANINFGWTAKAGYGFASVGLSACELLLQVYLLELYILSGLNPSLAGTAIAIAVIWDAISDPLMGILSDKTPAKRLAVRRIPYLVAGAILLGAGFSVLFSPPVNASQAALFGHLLAWYLVVNTAMTLYGVPYLALVNDLARSEAERASLFSWRIVLGSLGLLVGIGLPAYFASQIGGTSIAEILQSRNATGIAIGVSALTGCLISAFAVQRQLAKTSSSGTAIPAAPYRILEILRQALRSPQFIGLATGFMAIAVGRSFNSSLALPYYRSTLKFSEDEFGIVILVLTIFIIIAAPLWVRLSRRHGKTTLFLSAVAGLATLSAIAYPSLPPKAVGPVLAVAAIGGIFVASVVLLDSLFSDYVESEKRRSGRDVSGAYYGIWRMLSKVARALGIACSGILLSLIGYAEGSLDQSYSTERGIAWAFGPGVAAFLALGAWAISRIRNTPEQPA